MNAEDQEIVFADIIPPPVVVQREGYIALLINGNEQEYHIENNRINSPEKLLGWISHLSEKTWVSTRCIQELISACETVGVRVNHNL